MPMELWLEMAAEHDVATEVMALVVGVLGCLNTRKMGSSSSRSSSQGGKMVKVSFCGHSSL